MAFPAQALAAHSGHEYDGRLLVESPDLWSPAILRAEATTFHHLILSDPSRISGKESP